MSTSKITNISVLNYSNEEDTRMWRIYFILKAINLFCIFLDNYLNMFVLPEKPPIAIVE